MKRKTMNGNDEEPVVGWKRKEGLSPCGSSFQNNTQKLKISAKPYLLFNNVYA